MTERRVVISGIGLLTPLGIGHENVWKALLEGLCGTAPVKSFCTDDYPAHLGGEVPGFDPSRFLRRQSPGQMGRASQMAVAAALLSLEDAGLVSGPVLEEEASGKNPQDWGGAIDEVPARRCGVVMGTTSGEPIIVERYNDARHAGKPDDFPARLFAQYPCSALAHTVADEFQWTGGALTIPTACAAGNYAIGYARDLILNGRLDLALAGGSDAFSRIPYAGFGRLGAIAPDFCRPFDRDRQGMIPGEGAAMLVLESESSARRRGARIYAEVLACGVSCDAHHMTAGHPEGNGAVRAIQAALRESRLDPGEIDYICAHGTGTPTNDRIESLAVHRVFGERARRLPMSSIKSMLGHTMGAASAIEAAACALAIHTGDVPPTINFQTPDPDCQIDCIPNAARRIHPKVVLNNAYAFGGTNASLCLRQWDAPAAAAPPSPQATPSMAGQRDGVGRDNASRAEEKVGSSTSSGEGQSEPGLPGESASSQVRWSSGQGPVPIAVTGMAVITEDSGIDPKAILGRKGLRPLDRAARLLACAAKQALEDAHLTDLLARDPSAIGLVNGTLVGGLRSIVDFDQTILEDSPKFVNPVAFANTVINAPAGQTAIKLGLQGLNSTITSGLTSSLTAIAYAADALRAGRARVLLAGGAEESSPYTQEAYKRLGLGESGSGSERGSPQEGAALLVLQPLDRARRPLALISGHGHACGTPATPPAAVLEQAISQAVAQAQVASDDIDLILNASIKDRRLADPAHAALESVFQAPLRSLPVQSLDSQTSDALGATSAQVVARAIRLFAQGDSPSHILIHHLTCDRQAAALIVSRT
ncbi:MAG TPA: beta-ketoacyl-[acyl-carrier-protein] synthase family protein [Acidobacteriota bacterium]|nr:beta-ketoacyl-[acyl-carrier-protein] synthase family protein [Acidobacteriota bacterium]